MPDDRDRCGCTSCKAEKKAGVSAGVITNGLERKGARSRTSAVARRKATGGNAASDETISLLPTAHYDTSSRPSLLTRTSNHLSTRLSSRSLVLLLLSTSFPTGLLDASTYTDFRMFASNQTGNVIVLTVAIAQGWNSRSLLSTVSVGFFALAGLVSGRWAHAGGRCPRRRVWVLGSSALQTFLCGLGLALLHAGRLSKDHWILLILLSFASGLQVSVARTSSIGEIPTAMLTSPLIDLGTDPNLFLPLRLVRYSWRRSSDPERRKPDPRTIGRNRRLIYIFILASGSTIGAAITKRWDTQVVLSVVVAVKACITVFVAIAPGDGDDGRWAVFGSGQEEEPEDAERGVGGAHIVADDRDEDEASKSDAEEAGDTSSERQGGRANRAES